MLLTRSDLAFNFCDVVIALKARGVSLLPADFLRMWVGGAVSPEKIEKLMSLRDCDALPSQCPFCLVGSTRPFVIYPRVRVEWRKVIVDIGDCNEHLNVSTFERFE